MLSDIPRRVIKDAFSRIIGNGDKVKGAIRTLVAKILKLPRIAIDNWKKYIIACKSKGLMDNIRSQKLKNCMTRIPNRTLKGTLLSLKGFSSKVTSALKSIFNGFKNKSKQAFVQWQKYLEGVKNKSLMDRITSERLRFLITSLVNKITRDINYILLANIMKIPRIAIDKWKSILSHANQKDS